MSPETRRRVGLRDVGRGLLGLAPDLPLLLRETPGMLLRSPSARNSLGLVFQKAAEKHPERPFLKGPGRVISYGEANRTVNRYADVLRSRGVGRGDVVGIVGHNDVELVLVMLAAVKLGAIAGLLNYNQRGEVLAHSIGLLDARVLVTAEDSRAAVAEVGTAIAGDRVLTLDGLAKEATGASPENPDACARTVAREKAFYIFTSGTTGMPKASVMSHFRWLKSYSGLGALGVRLHHDDTMYCPLPLYHNNAVTVALGAVLVAGASMAIAPKFTASGFWRDCIEYDATAFVYIGELCRYLLAQPASRHDRGHRVRVIVGNGLRPDIWMSFQQRFGIARIAEFYGASECNIAFINAFNVDETAGTCPLPYKVVAYDQDTGKARRDARGRLTAVKKGEVGLLLGKVTQRVPFDGYTDDSESESKLIRDAFRTGDCWYDTGDLVLDQGLMHVAFVDRLGDTFRWKGENVATTQVEAALDATDQVQESSVFGIEVPGTDGRAGMAAVLLADGHDFDGAALSDAMLTALPSYAVPLFVRVVDTLEHTTTFKPRKVELRKQGYRDVGGDSLYVLAGREGGYVPFTPDYLHQVASAEAPRL